MKVLVRTGIILILLFHSVTGTQAFSLKNWTQNAEKKTPSIMKSVPQPQKPLRWNSLSLKEKRRKLNTAKVRVIQQIDKVEQLLQKLEKKDSTRTKAKELMEHFETQRATVEQADTPEDLEHITSVMSQDWKHQKQEIVSLLKK